MPNYKESVLTGKRWKRAGRVLIENPIDPQGKAITFIEEIATQLDDGTMNNTPAGQVREVLTDPTEKFQLFNPLDDTPIDGATAAYQDVYVFLHSLYLHLAAKRDAAEAAVALEAIQVSAK